MRRATAVRVFVLTLTVFIWFGPCLGWWVFYDFDPEKYWADFGYTWLVAGVLQVWLLWEIKREKR